MSSGYSSGYADVIETNDLKEIVGDLVDDLIKKLEDKDYVLDTLARDFQDDGDDIDEETFKEAEVIYQVIRQKFKDETGLELELFFHDSDNNGDCYDEVEGAYWAVWGMYELTKEGKKINKDKTVVERRFFVNYG